MEGVYEELDEAKAEIEKLKQELKWKSELSENLKNAHSKHLRNATQSNLKIEKQTREIIEKEEEISELKETLGELQGSLKEKESISKHLRLANEKLRVSFEENLKKQKEESEGLCSALDEANQKIFGQDQRIQNLKDEINGLKRCLSSLKEKSSEDEKIEKRVKEERAREDAVFSLEEQMRKVEDQFKWKKEQFSHLEEAHRKIKQEFKSREKEWDLEKSSLLDEIFSIQTRLDSQIRVSEDLRIQLRTCNQSLAREETRRKLLEAQLSDVQNRFENVFGDYRDAKSRLDDLTEKRDEEIGSLRHSLGQNEAVLKETEYQKRRIEQENEELRISLKEFRESQIQKSSSVSPSVAKLRNKKLLKAIEDELNSQIEGRDKMIAGLRSELKQTQESFENFKRMKLDLESRDIVIEELGMALQKKSETLKNMKSDLESRDVVIEELRMALENFHTRETTKINLEKKYISQLASKDEMIASLELGLDQLREEHSSELATRESKKASNDLEKEKSVKELRIELERVRDQETDRKSRMGMMVNDLENLSSKLERKQLEIKELKSEIEQQREDCYEKLRAKEADLSNYRSELERKDGKIKALGSELEQVLGDFNEVSKTKEEEWTCLLESTSADLIKCRLERDDRDSKIKELGLELEQVRDDFAESFKTLEMMTRDLKKCKFERDSRDAMIVELMKDSLELKLQNEEISVMLLVLKNGICDAQMKISSEKAEMEMEFRKEHEKADKELNRYVEMFMESLTREEFMRRKLKEVFKELDRTKARLFEAEFEIYEWESITERFKTDLEESTELRRELEASLLAQVIVTEAIESEKQCLDSTIKERDDRIASLESQASKFLEESLGREIDEFLVANIREERRVEKERVKGNDLIRVVESLKSKINSSSVSFSAQLAQKQAEIDLRAREHTEEKKLMIEEIEIGRRTLLEDVAKYSTSEKERESLLAGFIGELDDQICELSKTDQNLMNKLENILLSCDLQKDLFVDSKENVARITARTTKFEANSDLRSPFREINHLV